MFEERQLKKLLWHWQTVNPNQPVSSVCQEVLRFIKKFDVRPNDSPGPDKLPATIKRYIKQFKRDYAAHHDLDKAADAFVASFTFLPSGPCDLEVFTRHPLRTRMARNFCEIEEINNQGPSYHVGLDRAYGDTKAWLALIAKQTAFVATGNPAFLAEAFLQTHTMGYYPPFWVLNHLADIFEQWLTDGKQSLDVLFAVRKPKAPGNLPSALEKEGLRRRDKEVCWHVYLLTVRGHTVDDAAQMVHDRMHARDEWDDFGIQVKILTKDVIKAKFYRARKALQRLHCLAKDFLRSPEGKAFLRSFKREYSSADRQAKPKYIPWTIPGAKIAWDEFSWLTRIRR